MVPEGLNFTCSFEDFVAVDGNMLGLDEHLRTWDVGHEWGEWSAPVPTTDDFRITCLGGPLRFIRFMNFYLALK
jgi:hypothetical protein